MLLISEHIHIDIFRTIDNNVEYLVRKKKKNPNTPNLSQFEQRIN